jgi:hypothetical protein
MGMGDKQNWNRDIDRGLRLHPRFSFLSPSLGRHVWQFESVSDPRVHPLEATHNQQTAFIIPDPSA